MTTEQINAREQLVACANWLGWQDEDLSFHLRKPEDGLKLWRYWQAHPDLPEMADEDIDGCKLAPHRRKALGYDPLGKVKANAGVERHPKGVRSAA